MGIPPRAPCVPRPSWVSRPCSSSWSSRRRDCHFAGTPSSSLLKRLLKGEGVQQNDTLADGYPGAHGKEITPHGVQNSYRAPDRHTHHNVL